MSTNGHEGIPVAVVRDPEPPGRAV